MNQTALTLDQELRLVRQSHADAQAFGVLYDHYFPRVFNYVYYRVREQGTADDLVSTIFMRALDRLDTFQESRGSFGVWLFRIAHNVVVDHYRKVARSATMPLEEELLLDEGKSLKEAGSAPPGARTVEKRLAQLQETEALMAQVSRLSEREQEIIGFKFGGGLTNRKIATLMGLKENHVAVILYRAMRKLRQGLAEGQRCKAKPAEGKGA